MIPRFLLLLLCCGLVPFVQAHVGHHPSVHDTVAGILDRMKRTVPAAKLPKLTNKEIESLLTPTERHVLGTEHISFRVNVPVTISIVRGPEPKEAPFWLTEQGF
ncbi:MAG TPA: hypothetical protein VEH27_14105, partial [Methylomirabilota bacterium]|nr:hypothetical protein [Methylomirabilota bacterium]